MLTNSMRRFSGRALAVFATVVILSDWTMAQQTGLFPLAPIRRTRPRCDQQDPVYKLYKDQYFGYHPTLWRKFPSGWGAPSPEAPDKEKSFKEIPLTPPEGLGEDQGDQGDQGQDMQGQPGGAQAPLPNPPAEDNRSPFEMDGPAAAPNGARPRNPNGANPPAGAEPSPFDKPGPRAGAPSAPRSSAPDLSAPAPTRTSRRGRPAEIDPADAGSPILAATDASASIDDRDAGLQDVSGAIDAPVATPAIADQSRQPAAKRSRIGTLMSGLGWNVRR
ncbi:MAG: hypothetical protein P4L85_23920 [Paludisphaera borealis]|uniref:hypothetical protein n=1 Tax=Paludisphaera borealis TaxID=1387353 RepID=UPI00283C8C50|nr:hypothetical protein [Paludisphaera borealis]MDR3622419.1 hypothetical protein [Paludisphaera borealis]